MSKVYTFRSPIKANRDGVKAKLEAAMVTTRTATVYTIKDKDGKPVKQQETAPTVEELAGGKTAAPETVYEVSVEIA